MRLLIFSDIHSDLAALRKLVAVEADYYFAAGDLVNWARGLEAVGEILRPLGKRLYVIPGNHESAQDIAVFCDQFGFNDFHEQSMALGGYHVAGLGYSSPTPFATPGEYTEEQLADRLSHFATMRPLILVCHCPPKNTGLDDAGSGSHFGSTAIKEFLDQSQPEYFFCGHVHEAAGTVLQLGKTKAVNVGKKGYLLELPDS